MKYMKTKIRFRVKFSLELGQSDDCVFLWHSQVARLQLLIQLSLRFLRRVPKLRVRLVLICSALLSVPWTFSVVRLHIFCHTFPSVFRRGATDQARVPHPWVQTQPVHHVVNTEKKNGNSFSS